MTAAADDAIRRTGQSRRGFSARPSPWLLLFLASIAGLGVFLYLYLLTKDLFIFTEARGFLLNDRNLHFDVGQFFFFPQPTITGSGRLTTVISYIGISRLCGVDIRCINGADAAILAIGGAAILLHSYQVARSALLATLATAIWCFSAPTLGAAMWQSVLVDKTALIAAIACSGFWYWALARERFTLVAKIGFVMVSVLLLAVAFNAKEITFYLPAVMITLAVTRGTGSGRRLRRNIGLIALPLCYALWFIVYTLLNVTPDLASHVAGGDAFTGLATLMTDTLGIGRNFMGLGSSGPWFETMTAIARLAYGVTATAIAIGVVVAVRETRRRGWSFSASRVIERVGPELYLLVVFVSIVAISARTQFPNAYYMLIGYWALALLVLLTIRRIAAASQRPRLIETGLVALVVLSVGSAYLTHFVDGSAVPRLRAASAAITQTGTQIAGLLQGYPVTSVAWRTVGVPDCEWYVLRGDGHSEIWPTPDIWPYLTGDATALPAVDVLTDETWPEYVARPLEFAQPGQAVVVISDTYGLVGLSYQGVVLSGSDTP